MIFSRLLCWTATSFEKQKEERQRKEVVRKCFNKTGLNSRVENNFDVTTTCLQKKGISKKEGSWETMK